MAADRAGAEMAYEAFVETKNPLFAFMAIALWPQEDPLPNGLRMYLGRWAEKVTQLTHQAAAGRLSPTDALAKLPAAFDLAGRKGRGRGAFAEVRELARRDRLQREYDSTMQEPRVKAIDAQAQMATKEGISAAQLRKLLGPIDGSDRPRVPDVRSRSRRA